MNKYVIHSGNNSRLLIKPLIDQRGNWIEASEQESTDFKVQFIWKPTVFHVRAYNQMDELFNSGFGLMIHNHLDNNREITTKTGLIRSLRSFYQNNEASIKAGYQVYDTIPTSFIITAHVEDEEYRQLYNRFIDVQNATCFKERVPPKHCEKNMWLIKPAALNQGRGIEVVRTLKEITSILKGKLLHSVWLVQKYVEKPLLFRGRKFDIRIWAVATGKHDFFYYKHGYLRTSSSEYDTEATDNYIHLTNNCLQKFGENYGVHEKGNTLSFEAFQAYIDSEFPQYSLNFWTHLLPRIKDLMIDSYLSAKKIINRGKRNKVFELFGFDFLIDEDFRVWLLEVNTNPYLGIPNEYIEGLLPKMLDDLLALVLDPYFPPKNPRLRKENDFELLYCEVASIYSADGTSKNFRQSFSAQLYPVLELAQQPWGRTKVEEEPHLGVVESARPIARDILQTVKEEIEMSAMSEPSEFSTISSRVISVLNNWELMSEEQIIAGVQALQLLSASNCTAAFVAYGHLPSIFNYCVSENVPSSLQLGALDSVAIGCQDTRFRKEIVKLGITEHLINFLLNPECEESLRSVALKAMIVISTHPAKKFYIPGETREHNYMRTRIINEGMLLCFYKLCQTADDKVKELVKGHLSSEYDISDWELQVAVLDRVLEGETQGKIAKSNLIRPCNENSVLKDCEVKVPQILNDKTALFKAREEINQFCEEKREEIKLKTERDRQKKQEYNDLKLKQQEIELKEHELKLQKAEEYINRRYEEIRRQKIEELKRQRETRPQDDKFDDCRKQLILEKLKKTEEVKRIQKAKLRKQEEDLKRIEEQKRKEIEEKRKRVMEEWLRSKNDKEREKKIIEKVRKEEETARREAEVMLRREEMNLKIEEKKSKMKKAKEEKREKHRKNESLLVEENSRAMLEKEDVVRRIDFRSVQYVPKSSPIVKELRIKRRKAMEKRKKRLISVTDQFLFEIYGSYFSKGNHNRDAYSILPA